MLLRLVAQSVADGIQHKYRSAFHTERISSSNLPWTDVLQCVPGGGQQPTYQLVDADDEEDCNGDNDKSVDAMSYR